MQRVTSAPSTLIKKKKNYGDKTWEDVRKRRLRKKLSLQDHSSEGDKREWQTVNDVPVGKQTPAAADYSKIPEGNLK